MRFHWMPPNVLGTWNSRGVCGMTVPDWRRKRASEDCVVVQQQICGSQSAMTQRYGSPTCATRLAAEENGMLTWAKVG